MDDRRKLLLARRQVRNIKGFYVHLAVFVGVMIVLAAIDYGTGPGWWVQWPFLGWGIGILGHAVGVFGRTPAAIARWEERKVAEIKQRLEADGRRTGSGSTGAVADRPTA